MSRRRIPRAAAGAALVAGLIAALGAVLVAPAPARAQSAWQPLRPTVESQPRRPASPVMSSGTHALLRALDKLKGESEELPMRVGETVRYGRLSITLQACRFPAENPASDALTFLEIRDAVDRELLFRGWMFASSPALNALDDRRYDVWPLRCTAETG